MIAVTCSGYTALMMARFHPSQPIIAATPEPRVARQLTIVRGVLPVLTKPEDDIQPLIEAALEGARAQAFLKEGDRVVISAGLPLNIPGNTNMIRVFTL